MRYCKTHDSAYDELRKPEVCDLGWYRKEGNLCRFANPQGDPIVWCDVHKFVAGDEGAACEYEYEWGVGDPGNCRTVRARVVLV